MKLDIIKLFNENKKFRTAVYLIAIAIVLIILLSGLFKNEKKLDEKVDSIQSTQEYVAALEHRVSELVSSIKGVGRSKVLVTLASSVETVYAAEDKLNQDLLKDSTSNSTRQQERRVTEQKYIVVQNANGGEEVLVQTTLEPKLRGIIIVCDGGDNPAIIARVTEAVSVALDLEYNRICVTKMTN